MAINCPGDIITFMTRIYNRNLTTASGGNISIKIDDKIYLTPTGKDKATLMEKDLAVLDFNSGTILSENKPSCEFNMHLEIYRNRPDINAIIHAHPPYTSIFSVIDTKIDLRLLSEAYIFLRKIDYVPYHMPSSIELANAAAQSALHHNTIVLRNHGVLAFGTDLMDCFHKVEILESLCFVQYHTLGRKDTYSLNDNDLNKIDEIF